ncbi:MAG: DUF366 family protein [Bdellovibrionota bacterium]
MKSKLLKEKFKYDGTQLRSLYAYMNYGLLGNSIIAWEGACNVSFEHMVDGEDLLAEAKIAGSHMLHFIVEVFNYDLMGAVPLQRLLASTVKEVLEQTSPVLQDKKSTLIRKGDDIFLKDHKLSISIATSSPVSRLIHFAVNVSNKGTPVKTLSLDDLKIKPTSLAKEVLSRFSEEVESMIEATQKVRPVQ